MGAQVCWRHRDPWTLRNDSKQGRCWRSGAGQTHPALFKGNRMDFNIYIEYDVKPQENATK